VYKNLETDHKYQESDELGGKDPYSASKAAAELVISSYRSSFNTPNDDSPIIAVARGGNIIGGGDWSEDRLIPDYMRALTSDGVLEVRFPQATRPWQHVISLVDGYLSILEGILGEGSAKFNRAFNLGPLEQEAFSVSAILSEISKHCPGVEIELGTSRLHEAGKLGLDSALAVKTFGWRPKWSTHEVVEHTALWYKRFFSGEESAFNLCSNQIDLWVGDSK
jgi:CDP-glucose 4,6-dehydratase